ncbi:MAG: M48 family metalloprotease [Reyranella sp.]|nr:M48 family metalloprotease [Reyranella sp.]MBL6652264.1 M48 family metalloprotease [Reyranella sp.]
MGRRALLALSGLLLLGGCSGAVHQLPPVSTDQVAAALAEVRSGGGGAMLRAVSDDEVRTALREAVRRIDAAASQVCREMNVGTCQWKFAISREHSLNAGALDGGLVVLNRGLVENGLGEEELCIVIAHEIAHHAANHVVQGRRNAAIGATVGAVLLGVATAAIASGQRDGAYAVHNAVQIGMRTGAMIGHLSFSKEQEREADYLGALILYRAGVDLDKARGLYLTMARSTERNETNILDSHPIGPDRLAAWDRAVAEIRASNGRLPPRAR